MAEKTNTGRCPGWGRKLTLRMRNAPAFSLLILLAARIVWTLALCAPGSPEAEGAGRHPVPVQSAVTIAIEGETRIIRANGIPDHPPGQFPRRGNPNSILAQDYSFRMPLHPHVAAQPAAPRGPWQFGVAINGVPFDPGTAEFWNNDRRWNFEALSGRIDLGLDEHHAHVQPRGEYHYHGLPTGLIARLSGDGSRMVLLGYAADGFPIYTAFGRTNPLDALSPLKKLKSGYRLKAGARPGSPEGPGGKYDGAFTADFEYAAGSGDLDECNGRFSLTPEYPAGTYCYHVIEVFPYIPRMWRGIPDPSFRKHGGPPGPAGGGPPGPPRELGFPP